MKKKISLLALYIYFLMSDIMLRGGIYTLVLLLSNSQRVIHRPLRTFGILRHGRSVDMYRFLKQLAPKPLDEQMNEQLSLVEQSLFKKEDLLKHGKTLVRELDIRAKLQYHYTRKGLFRAYHNIFFSGKIRSNKTDTNISLDISSSDVKRLIQQLTSLPVSEKYAPGRPVALVVAPVTRPLLSVVEDMATGGRVPPAESMRHESLRLSSFRAYPGEDKPFSIRFAQAGFYYASNGDEVVCYCCGKHFSNWSATDKPMDVHRSESPLCPFLMNNSAVNAPVTNFLHVNRTETRDNMQTNNVPLCETTQLESNQVSSLFNDKLSFDARPEYTGQTMSSLDFDSASSSLSSNTSSSINYGAQRKAPPSGTQETSLPQGKDNVSSQHTSARTNRWYTTVNSSRPQPKYPRFVRLYAREESFATCPDLPVDADMLAEAGLFYTGTGDCTRCFQCGVGLRHWSVDDDPWVEHARYSLDCAFVRERKGEEFVHHVKQAIEDNKDAPSADKIKSKESGNISPTQPSGKAAGLANTTAREEGEGLRSDVVHGQSLTTCNNTHASEALDTSCSPGRGIQAQATDDCPDSTSHSVPACGPGFGDRTSVGSPLTPPRPTTLRAPGTVTNMSVQATSQGKGFETGKSLQEKANFLRQMSVCSKCERREVCMVFLPCGHLVTCEKCAGHVTTCFICSQTVKGTIRTFRR